METVTIQRGHPLSLRWSVENLHRRGQSWAIDQESFVAIYDGDYEIDRLTPDVGLGLITHEEVAWELHAYISDTSFFPVADLWFQARLLMVDGEVLLEDDGVIRVEESSGEPTSVQVYPWDLLNPAKDRATRELRFERMQECRSCDQFFHGVCKTCHCVLRFKTSLQDATCPIGKW